MGVDSVGYEFLDRVSLDCMGEEERRAWKG